MIPTGVNVFNSLGRKMNPLMREENKPLRVYTCGPTVYADSHLGHARTYVSLDMIRRIIGDYFEVPLFWVMNVTDVDDKIINAFNAGNTGFKTAFEYSKDRESAYFKDMDNLNVRRPDSVLRVSEVIPEIHQFIQDLIDKGFAYPCGGSVYFNVAKYEADGRFVYAELERESYNADGRNAEAAESGTTKLSPNDFALWKAAKPGEPFWDSPWGRGRPGWHIECSTMSSMFFGKQFDVHCGGIDLRFPHHTNEIAQSQAHHGVVPWVRNWLHTGQLRINGEKMSKSLGNYRTISQFLGAYTWQQIRMMFALVEWQTPMDLTDGLILNAISLEKRIRDFIQMTELKSKEPLGTQKHGYSEADNSFSKRIQEANDTVRAAFADNFDIPKAMNCINELVGAAYSTEGLNDAVVIAAGHFVSHIMSVLGFSQAESQGAFNLTEVLPQLNGIALFRRENLDYFIGVSKELDSLAKSAGVDFRKPLPSDASEVQRQIYSIVTKSVEANKKSLSVLDYIRDDIMPVMGVRQEDNAEGGIQFFKIGSPEELALRKKAKAIKAVAAENAAAKAVAKPVKPAEHPKDFFMSQKDKYSAWDETGFPTADAQGQPLSKSQHNKLRKQYDLMLQKFNKLNPKEGEPK